MSSLTTIPPELLLSIISHLPSSNSFHALSQTSHYFASFLNTHAATICNTRIQQRYSQAATILQSSYTDGWLVPRHHCITETEERWQAEQALQTPSLTCLSQPININNCCFRTESTISATNSPPRILHLLSPRQTDTDITTSPTSTTHTPLLSTQPPHHQDLSLSLALGLQLKLSRPGPHYLCFLERYSGEITARWVMSNPTQEPPNTSTKHFDFMISRYCIRAWLVMCAEAFSEGLPSSNDFEKESKLASLKRTFQTVVHKSKDSFSSLKDTFRRKQQKKPTARILFGEIDSEDEKASLGIEKDVWVTGLLWYYGYSNQLASTPLPTNNTQTHQKAPKLKSYTTTLTRHLRYKSHQLEPKLRNAWKSMTCRGRFELLD